MERERETLMATNRALHARLRECRDEIEKVCCADKLRATMLWSPTVSYDAPMDFAVLELRPERFSWRFATTLDLTGAAGQIAKREMVKAVAERVDAQITAFIDGEREKLARKRGQITGRFRDRNGDWVYY